MRSSAKAISVFDGRQRVAEENRDASGRRSVDCDARVVAEVVKMDFGMSVEFVAPDFGARELS